MRHPTDVVVITGASAGVGRALARELAARGSRLGLIARGRAGLKAACKEAEAMGAPVAAAAEADVADPDAVEACAARFERELGPVDVWVPDVAARAIAWAAEHAPRELHVGSPTVATRLANKAAPALVDRYLARGGIEDQQTDEPVDPETWTDNLDAPADADEASTAGSVG